MAAGNGGHGRVYRALRKIAPLQRVVRAVRGFLEVYRPPAWLLQGAEHHTGQPLSIFFAGLLENKNYIARLAFASDYTEVACGWMWLWSACRLAKNRRASHDIAIIDSDTSLARRLKRSDAFVVPNWIRGELELATALQQMKRSESVKTDLRRIRQRSYHYEVRREECEFERFYHDMYLPYAKRTYEGETFLMTHEDLRKFIPQSELLWIKDGAEEVAAQLLLYEGGIPRAYALGVKGGDQQYVRTGALAAAYYFTILYVKERGAQRLHLGGSRPFLRDGVLQFKKKWGVRIVDKSPRFFVLTRTRNTKPGLSFLANNPFFFENDGALSGAIFVDRNPDTPHEAIARWRKEFEEMGISHVQVFDDVAEQGELSRGRS